MRKRSFLSIIISALMIIALFTGCGGNTQTDQKTDKSNTSTEKSEALKDGDYKAEAQNFDSKGWKPFVQIQVKDGKIVSAKYDYVNKEGKYITQDQDYNKNMSAKTNGMNPVKYSKQLADDLVNRQDASKVDTVTGATESSEIFKELSEKLIENAKKGDTADLKVGISE
ncbi:MAG: FMN-binding protein [Clostridium sp.]|jgi:major membrane immunogen (membrane-anchored lipoprotein)|uniref:FMN-binding protein n=1 Tax=Clostridium sp. TaxID=1506 RepID=UPI0025C72038|nr:FMN-binding protein [Clostridium sp.]MCH3963763.1 FMN-binding protein [Clostridium sp.]MCI1714904.1 FMN-binding protein [Clostridium sp.]MCI1798907.1 FMN-binding protein [Clostridium sp.]MCI1813087.1 FMN-binding protein [Clostridium sp.]MCI1869977.1 FMN-binding protein [Clostridium sp.]